MKPALKRLIQVMFLCLGAPLVVCWFIYSLLVGKDQAITSFAQMLSLFPGVTGNYLRAAFYRLTLTHCDQDVVISFATLFSQRDTIIESGSYIGPQCNIGRCRISRNCLLGSGVHIMSGKGQHNFSDPDKPLREQGGSFQQVTIGEDSWLGNGALIMADVGKKCIVGAGAVVINPVPDYAIVGGNPAKIIGTRANTDHHDS